MSPHVRISYERSSAHYHCGWTTDGRDFEPVGCDHDTPRAAIDHADDLERAPRAYPPRVDPAPVDWSKEDIP